METTHIDALCIPAAGCPKAPTKRRRGKLPLLAWAWLCLQRRRQRRLLAELPDHLLKDIGITRREARLEARRPFWK